MIKRPGLSLLALLGGLMFVAAPQASAGVRFGVAVGPAYPPPYAYQQPYPHPHEYNTYPAPAYGYYDYGHGITGIGNTIDANGASTNGMNTTVTATTGGNTG